jgi:tRNA (cytidine/uridine-2'-O-)-methyltransferase
MIAPPVRLVLFQPDIPQNLGAMIRLSACFGLPLEIIEPCGFPLTDSRAKRAALDYGPEAVVTRHSSWESFSNSAMVRAGRVVLFTTRGSLPLQDFRFGESDLLMFGRESAGVPDDIAATIADRVRIPLSAGARSLNVAMSAGIAAFEAMRQLGAVKLLS